MPLALLAFFLLVLLVLASQIEEKRFVSVRSQHTIFTGSGKWFSSPQIQKLSWTYPPVYGNPPHPPPFSIAYDGEEIPLSSELATWQNNGFKASGSHNDLHHIQKGRLKMTIKFSPGTAEIIHDQFQLLVSQTRGTDMAYAIEMSFEEDPGNLLLNWNPQIASAITKTFQLPPSMDILKRQFGPELRVNRKLYLFGIRLPF